MFETVFFYELLRQAGAQGVVELSLEHWGDEGNVRLCFATQSTRQPERLMPGTMPFLYALKGLMSGTLEF